MLEAMALGKPSVVTAVGGIPEVISDGVEGYLVPRRDPAALAEKVLALHRDPSLRARMGAAAAKKVVCDFGMERLVHDLENLYLKVLEKKGKKIPSSASAAASPN
jgi:glycosyltransferase involved in cell wall biosynthesis